MITQNTSKDDAEFQRSEIISDLWKDLADNEKTGDYKILDNCRYDLYEPIEGETYVIVPTERGKWFMVKPLSMRDLARTFAIIQPKRYESVVIDHVNKCKSVVNQYFQDLKETDDIDTNGSTLEPRDIHEKHIYTKLDAD